MKHSDWAELLIVLQSFFLADVSIRSALSFPPQVCFALIAKLVSYT